MNLEEKIVSAIKRTCSASVPFLSATLPAIPVVCHASNSSATLESVRRHYKEYHVVGGNSNEASEEMSADGVSLIAWSEQ